MEYSEWIIVGLTALLVMVSALGSVATYFTLRSQIDPHVIVYAESDRDRPSLIVLVIENIGRGVAHDVRFRLAQPMPANAFGFEDAAMPKTMADGPLIEGIPSLAPGGRRVINWGQFGGLTKFLGSRVVSITAEFTSRQRTPWDPQEHSVTSTVDVQSFSGTDASRPPLVQIADHLKDLNKIGQALVAEVRALGVDDDA